MTPTETKIANTERPTLANLRVASEALVEVPADLPEPFSVTAWPQMTPSIHWHVTDADEYDVIRAWLATLDGYLSDHAYDTGTSVRIAATNAPGVTWQVSLIRELVTQ